MQLASIFIRNARPRVGLFRWQQHKYNNQYERVKENLGITPVQIHSPVLYPRSSSISTELFPRHHGIFCSKCGEMAELNIYFFDLTLLRYELSDSAYCNNQT